MLAESLGGCVIAAFDLPLITLRAACNGMNALAVPVLVFSFCGPSGDLCIAGGGPRFGGPS